MLGVPLSLGAIQKVLDRMTQAIEPHYTAIGTQARHAPVNKNKSLKVYFVPGTLVPFLASDDQECSTPKPRSSASWVGASSETRFGRKLSRSLGFLYPTTSFCQPIPTQQSAMLALCTHASARYLSSSVAGYSSETLLSSLRLYTSTQ